MASRGSKILIGCGVGCGGLLLIAIAVTVTFFIWVSRRGELVEPELLLGSDTSGYVEWTLRLEDPGTRNLVERLLDVLSASRHNASTPLPPALQTFLGNMQDKRSRRKAERMFPMVVAWSMRPDESSGDDLHLWTASMESLGNKVVLADWFLGFALERSPDVRVVHYLGEKIYAPQDSPIVFFLRRSSLFFSTDVESARLAVERLDRLEPRDGGQSATGAIFTELPTEFPLRGAITNRRGELSRLWETITDGRSEVPWDGLVDVSFSGGFSEDAAFAARISLTGADEAWARDHASALISALRETLSDREFPVELEGSAEGRSIRLELRIPDLPGLVESGLGRLIAIESGQRD